jgi:alanyl-tRNA synthetase
VSVVDTVDVDDDVVHVVTGRLMEATPVDGVIDWQRRFDHMQQHTGQHVLSAAFDRLFDNRTVSFHMGTDVSTIDLARQASVDEIERAVDEANRVVWSDRAVSIRFVSLEEANRLPLRKEPTRGGTLRLVEIPDFDLSACGGTHVSRTGEIGVIAVIASERFKGGSRVTFVCGHRAVRALRGYRDAVSGSIRVLSVLPAELPAAVERLQAEGKDLRKTIGRLQESLAVHEAARLLNAATASGSLRVVIEVIEGWDAQGLKAIAAALSTNPNVAAVLLSSSTPSFVVVSRLCRRHNRREQHPATVDRAIRRTWRRETRSCTGGGLNATPADLVAAARALLVEGRAL